MVGEADNAGAQPDMAGALCGGGNEQLRGRDGFPAGAVMLANPGFVITQIVQPLHQFQIPVNGQSWVFADSVKRPQEYAEFHALRQVHFAHLINQCCSNRFNIRQ